MGQSTAGLKKCDEPWPAVQSGIVSLGRETWIGHILAMHAGNSWSKRYICLCCPKR